MMIRNATHITLCLILLPSCLSNAWGACEAEIERAIQADADFAAPQIASMMQSNSDRRIETVSERKVKKRSMWNATSNEYQSRGKENAARNLQIYTKDLNGRDRSSTSLGTKAVVAENLAHICLANQAIGQASTTAPNSNSAILNNLTVCRAEVERGTRNDTDALRRVIAAWKEGLSFSREQLIQNVSSETKSLEDARRYGYGGNAVAFYEMHICVWNAALNGFSPDGSRTVPAEQQAAKQSENAQLLSQTFKAQKSENQKRADQERQGKLKTNDVASQAHECIAIDPAGSGNFGAFKNICGFKVNFYSCNYKPRSIQGGFNWSADFDCEKQQFGLYTPSGGRSEAAHNRNTEMVYLFACKAPATPVDAKFVVGKGIEARCHN